MSKDISFSKPIYKVHLRHEGEARWLGAHLKKFLEQATQQGKKMVIITGDHSGRSITDLEDLQGFVSNLRVHLRKPEEIKIQVFFCS